MMGSLARTQYGWMGASAAAEDSAAADQKSAAAEDSAAAETDCHSRINQPHWGDSVMRVESSFRAGHREL